MLKYLYDQLCKGSEREQSEQTEINSSLLMIQEQRAPEGVKICQKDKMPRVIECEVLLFTHVIMDNFGFHIRWHHASCLLKTEILFKKKT